MKTKDSKIKVIDLFCGIGGLTHGLIKEGLDVVAGIDNDSSCKFVYEYNNKIQFIDKDILKVTAEQINDLFGKEKGIIRVLAGCAPCQPFSKLNLNNITKKQLEPLGKFAQLITQTQPDIVSMENVSDLAIEDKYPVFKSFLRTHKNKKITVRDVISYLEPIKAGETSKKDPLHRSRKLAPINLQRIKTTPHNGGNCESWSKELMLECHKKESGKTYRGSVYGRMCWDKPSPTMTTQCIGLGNGRYGHPTQNRAISLREAAIFQTFPEYYQFSDPTKPIQIGKVAKFIGNAVPVRLGSVIGS